MRQNRKIPLKEKPKYAIVVDGETEFWYIQMLKRNERLISVDLKPEIPQRKKLSEQYAKVIELSKDYKEVYWIIDFDAINKETRETKKGKKTALYELEEYYYSIREIENIHIIINNPCFEYWLLLHFEATVKFYSTYDEMLKQLKKHLPDYEKTQKYYTKQDKDIYLRLKAQLSVGIASAKKTEEFDFANPKKGISQMHILIEDIFNPNK